MRRWLMILIVLTFACVVAADGPAPAKQTGRKLALLVGVTKYDFLNVKQLTGPANDVLLMRKTLIDCFGFADKDIVILADRPEAVARPTRANIKSHFDRLAKEAMPDDQIVILFGGHGDQQPDQEPFDEPDGLDQIFLPCDAIKESPDAKAIKNAIIDDEVEVWTKAITARGASLWMIFDCCHSATMLRGPSDEVSRSVPEGTLISIAAIREAQKLAANRRETTRSGDAKAPAKKPENKTPKLVAIYACERSQETPELTAPRGGTERHGLLTYTICEVLTKAKTKLTYKELVDRVRAKYVALLILGIYLALMQLLGLFIAIG